MIEPWFDPIRYAWIPGTTLGVLGGILGGLGGVLVGQGKAKSFVLGGMYTLLGISVTLLIAGLTALGMGQPYGVWYGLGLAGLIGTIVIGANIGVVHRGYRMAEERKMAARDLVP